MPLLPRSISLTLLAAFLLVAPVVTLAAPQTAPQIELENRLASKNLRELILNNIPNLLIGLVGTVALIMFFINAIRYLISAGNQEGTGLAKTGMLMAIIGLVITLAAFTIVSSVKNLLGP